MPIGIPTIQKYVPTTTGSTSTKNNLTVGNETENSNSSGMISTTGKNLLLIWLVLIEKLLPRTRYLSENQTLMTTQTRIEI